MNNDFEILKDPRFNIRLKELRSEKDLSLRELSRVTGLSTSTISEIENEKCINPTCITLIKLTKGLNCKFEDLVNID